MDTPKKKVRLTKKGLPDKRSQTSKNNLSKARSKVKNLVKKSKSQKKNLPVYEEGYDEDSDDSDTEYVINLSGKGDRYVKLNERSEPKKEAIKTLPVEREEATDRLGKALPLVKQPAKKIERAEIEPVKIDPYLEKYNELQKSMDEMKTNFMTQETRWKSRARQQEEANARLRYDMKRNNNYKALNSMSQRMMMKFS